MVDVHERASAIASYLENSAPSAAAACWRYAVSAGTIIERKRVLDRAECLAYVRRELYISQKTVRTTSPRSLRSFKSPIGSRRA